MKKILIGSRAMSEHMDIGRDPLDTDYIGTFEYVNEYSNVSGVKMRTLSTNKVVFFMPNKEIIELEVAWAGSTGAELIEYVRNDINTLHFDDYDVPSLDVLYAIKMTHRFKRDITHFEKTRRDILHMESEGAKIPEDLQDWYKRRLKETLDFKSPSLNQDKASFFTDAVDYYWDHDSIHEVVARGHRPAYMEYKIPEEDVKCSRELFEECSFQSRLNGVIEEATVLAIERSIYPYYWDKPEMWESVYRMSLLKVCTTITSGWFRDFAWRNYSAALTEFDAGDIYKFIKAAESGEVKLHGK